ncbi:putative P-loop ATPase [Sphingobium herbicidovorans NBRC 16415]|uniref:P-loop ATPase n=1 Tax=Sphingobium herbicidovorans (strain ATCC 700291 / DSM 11019 / CCUG 56400 / KCTC 2939 / LMG 18315 / NBRC 16415 / MH) TaxID=1219045 RepID=A0A086PEE1_SPHHM|nr:KAP family NTPase [Sphingobium herbicidovorans]KFG91759.1 putative P-loop ATPase [Sphingobium herbicidovorans NBRC 16415]
MHHGDVGFQDRPIERQNDDALDRGALVESLIRSLVRDEVDPNGRVTARRARGYVVGLTGSWGLGKSSILNLLKLKLSSMDRVIVCLFNPWLFNGRDELLRGFFSELRDAMGRSSTESARGMVAALDQYWGAIDLAAHASAAFIDLHGGGGAATTGWTKWKDRLRAAIKKPADRSPQQERRSLEKKLKESNSAIVVLVDELDRVEDEEVRAVAQLIKAIGDIKGVSYLVAYDPKRVTEALGRGDHKRGEAYLEKIVQYPIPLRPLFANDVQLLVDSALRSHGLQLSKAEEKHEQDILAMLIKLIETPRDVKRLIGAYAILEAAVRGEVCPFDVLGYSWIATKAPGLRARIAADINAVVDDPSEAEMVDRVVRRMNKEASQTVSEVLGPEATSLEPLLRLLFPRFSESHAEQPNRIGHRRNLVRLLYLGNPPDMLPRTEVERVWNLTDPASLERALTELLKEGRLRAFLDRADDLYRSLDPTRDSLFWPTLASLLRRPSDWATGADERRAIAEDATSSVIQLAMRDDSQGHRVETIMEALMDSGDLVLGPAILRKQMFAHGLTKHSRGERYKAALGRKETESFISREIPRYRDAVMEGTALRRLPNSEAIFAISNLDLWDDELKANFLAQLDGAEALSTFASLMVPPGYTVDVSTLNELADAEVISRRIANIAPDDWPKDPYLLSCLRRLEAAAKGSELMFEGLDRTEDRKE